MNLYFVFEGKTEPIIYKSWLSYLLPELKPVNSINEIIEKNYYYVSDSGIPDCYNLVVNAIDDINNNKIKFDYLILCLDAERLSIEERLEEANNEVEKRLKSSNIKPLRNCKFIIIVQNICIETWFLGNSTIVSKNPQNKTLREYKEYFDVSLNDPELMTNNKSFGFPTNALFHGSYIREIFKEKGLNYSKTRPIEVCKEYYLIELINRFANTKHISSFNTFIELCNELKKKIEIE